MKLICNFKRFKEARQFIEESLQPLLIEELYNSESYYGPMPDDSLKTGCEGTANVIIEKEEDIDTLQNKYELNIFQSTRFSNEYSYKRNVFYVLSLISSTNEFVVSVYIPKRVLDNFQKTKEDFNRLICSTRKNEKAIPLSFSATAKRYYEEFEGWKPTGIK